MINPSWESQFARWASAPSHTEQSRCENTVTAIRKAIQASARLNTRSTKIFVQGSYRNRVNVRNDSDVDVGVICNDVFLSRYPPGKRDADFGNVSGGYSYGEFKNDLESSLVDHFGRAAVQRGNKAFQVDENTYRVNADVVPLFEFRQYWEDGSYRAGVALCPDRGGRIENYPERLFEYWPSTPLHYENGVAKNTLTGRSFKGVVRILKCLLNQMKDEGIDSARNVPGYLCECLAYNCPYESFVAGGWCNRVERVVNDAWMKTSTDENCREWLEVDGIKYLFHQSQGWSRAQAFVFLCDLRRKLGI